KSDFTRLRSAHPSVTESVILFLCDRLRRVSDKLETIALYPLEARLARFLVLSLRGREETPGKRVPLELAYSQTELAQLLGASRPKLNAALGELERVGAVKRTSDRLFCDRAKLAEIAQLD
ncbi:MAG TPA: helix-turn-helix domain-containing protein, partial [Methylocystis sp.]|nr:helix-turn-helix domain-containing protein [Methylocystis sp.]